MVGDQIRSDQMEAKIRARGGFSSSFSFLHEDISKEFGVLANVVALVVALVVVVVVVAIIVVVVGWDA